MSKYDLYLNDILRAINSIETSILKKQFKDFELDNNLIDASSMRLQIIGESVNKLSPIHNKYKNVNWKKYLQTRNIISHAYFAIDLDIIWSIIKKDIPKLKKEIQEIIQKENLLE